VEGVGPRLHHHRTRRRSSSGAGTATFTIGTDTVVGRAGQVLVVPAGVAHKFRTAPGGYEAVHIHAANAFDTEWLG